MDEFEALFGVKNTQIKKNCLLLPIVQKEIIDKFKIKQFFKGELYAVANSAQFSLINTRIGAGFVGDAVLYLKNTACRNIFLFGSCGLVREKEDLTIGSLISPSKCWSCESFSEMLLADQKKAKLFYPDKRLHEDFLIAFQKYKVREAACSTLASLKLEQEMVGLLIKKDIDVVDMECSAFFSAAKFSGLKAVALFYVSDIIKKKPFYSQLTPALKIKLTSAIAKAAEILKSAATLN